MLRRRVISCARFLNVLTDSRADLDHRLDHLGLDLLAENHLPFFEKFGNVAAQFPSFRVDNLKLFLNSQGELVKHQSCSLLRECLVLQSCKPC